MECTWSVAAYIFVLFFLFKQKTAYEMRISDWSSDVCSSDLGGGIGIHRQQLRRWLAVDRDTTGAVPVQSLDAFACERGLVTMAEARGHIHAGLRSAPTTKTFRR